MVERSLRKGGTGRRAKALDMIFAGGRSTVPDTRPAARGEGPEPEVEKRRRRPSPGGEVARQEEEQKARKDGGPWPCALVHPLYTKACWALP